jgi:large subunit ribosomal protein L4
MATVEVRDTRGEIVEERELPADLFDAPVNVPVMHQVVVAGMAAQRAGTHSTKTRGEVAGGGKKPWRQKGTGRARHGSVRSPIWSGGGVAHGPKPRDYSMRVNKKMKKAALRSALTDAAKGGKLALVDRLEFDGPRTRDAVAVLETLGLEGRVLLVIAAPDEALEKSFRNLHYVKIDYPRNLSTYDLLYADRVLFTVGALEALSGEAESPSEEPREEAPDHPEPEPETSEESGQEEPEEPDASEPESDVATHEEASPEEQSPDEGTEPSANPEVEP